MYFKKCIFLSHTIPPFFSTQQPTRGEFSSRIVVGTKCICCTLSGWLAAAFTTPSIQPGLPGGKERQKGRRRKKTFFFHSFWRACSLAGFGSQPTAKTSIRRTHGCFVGWCVRIAFTTPYVRILVAITRTHSHTRIDLEIWLCMQKNLKR